MMKVVNQKGTAAYDLEKAYLYKLESKESYGEDQETDDIYVIRLYFQPENPSVQTIIAVFQDKDMALNIYLEFLKAIANGNSVFDFSGLLENNEPDLEEYQEL